MCRSCTMPRPKQRLEIVTAYKSILSRSLVVSKTGMFVGELDIFQLIVSCCVDV